MALARVEPLGNPTGSHGPAQRARRLLEEARDEVAELLGRSPGEIVFTSGGTESANLAVFGTLAAAVPGGGGSVVCSMVEHPAVWESCQSAATSMPVQVRALPVDPNGRVDLGALAELLDDQTLLVAVMLANNETGVIEPLAGVVNVVRERSTSTRIFTDAVQASSFLSLAEATSGVDLVGLNAHKIGGPVGVGVLVVGSDVALTPHQHGGGQERERRSGTQDVVGAVGFAAALRLAQTEWASAATRVGALREQLADGLLSLVSGSHRTVPTDVSTLPGHLHLCFSGIEREELLVALGELGICASGGSSCASGALEPSRVLSAMGVPAELAQGAIRFTLGHGTTPADIERALAIVPGVVAGLRHE